jgi:hypothetical protein
MLPGALPVAADPMPARMSMTGVRNARRAVMTNPADADRVRNAIDFGRKPGGSNLLPEKTDSA